MGPRAMSGAAMKKLYLIDGSGYIFRAYYGMARDRTMRLVAANGLQLDDSAGLKTTQVSNRYEDNKSDKDYYTTNPAMTARCCYAQYIKKLN